MELVKNFRYISILLILTACAGVSRLVESTKTSIPIGQRNKYGSEATRLSLSHEFIQTASAPDYWALAPYYEGQTTDSACSLATAVMIVNAARVDKTLKSDEPLVTGTELLKKLNDKSYEASIDQGGNGVSLAQMKTILEKSLSLYGIEKAKVEMISASEASEETQLKLHKHLVQNESSSRNFIVAISTKVFSLEILWLDTLHPSVHLMK